MRTEMVGVRFTQQELILIKEKSRTLGLTVASFVRMASVMMVDQVKSEGN